MDVNDPATRIVMVAGPSDKVEVYAIPCGMRIATKTDVDFHRLTCPMCGGYQ